MSTAQAPQGMGTAPRLPELQERWDSAARDAQGGVVGVSVQGQGLDSDPGGTLPAQDIL